MCIRDRYKELPAADDEFAKDVSEYDTLDEFKASIRKNMEESAEKQAELEVENTLVDQLVATLEDVYKRQMWPCSWAGKRKCALTWRK